MYYDVLLNNMHCTYHCRMLYPFSIRLLDAVTKCFFLNFFNQTLSLLVTQTIGEVNYEKLQGV